LVLHASPAHPTSPWPLAGHGGLRQVRLLQVDAREAQELVDHANRADERMVADELGSKVLVPQGAVDGGISREISGNFQGNFDEF